MISGHSFSTMSDLVLPFIIPSMHYKFPGPRLRPLRGKPQLMT